MGHDIDIDTLKYNRDLKSEFIYILLIEKNII